MKQALSFFSSFVPSSWKKSNCFARGTKVLAPEASPSGCEISATARLYFKASKLFTTPFLVVQDVLEW